MPCAHVERCFGAWQAQLDVWIERIQEMHEAQPLLLQDQRNIRAALDQLGESSEWLTAEEEEEEEAAEEEGA